MLVNTIKAAEKVFNRYETQHNSIKNYFGILAYYALAQAADIQKDDALMKKCKEYSKLYPDNIEHPYYNFEAYRVGGIAKAWLFYKGYIPSAADELREYAIITMNSPHSSEGILSHPKFTQRVWIDTVAFVTPFMLYIGRTLGEEKYIDYAVNLCFKSYELFTDKTNGLLHQCQGFLENPWQVSADHWSRGNGWGYFGITELIQHLPENSGYRKKAVEYYISHTDALIEHQTERGLWRQEIPEELAWYESSGTGLILYGIGVGIRCGILKDEKYMEAFRKGIEGIGKYCLTSEYKTLTSCPSCLCPGFGKEKGSVKAYVTEKYPKDDEPHSYGCIMLALVEAYKNGIETIEITQ